MERGQLKESLQFKNPEEEISFLRGQLADKEKIFEGGLVEPDKENATKKTIEQYSEKKQEEVLDKDYALHEKNIGEIALDLSPEEHDNTMEELLGMVQEKGIKNTLEVVKKMNNPHITDDFHRFLVQYIQYTGANELAKDNVLFKALNMKLYEISLPSEGQDDTKKTFKDMVSAMEQFYAGMIAIADGKEAISGRNYFTLEIALQNVSREVVIYASVPSSRKDLFEKQITAVFPDAKIREQKDDYNIFNEDGASVGAEAVSARSPVLPIKTYDAFDVDPMNVLLNVFSKLEEEGEGASIQILIAPAGDYFIKRYGKALDAVRAGANTNKATDIPETFTGELTKTVKEMFTGTGVPKKYENIVQEKKIDDIATEQIKQKISSTILSTNIRVIASAKTQARAQEILNDIQSAFHQFDNAQGNSIIFNEKKGKQLLRFFQEFSYRTFTTDVVIPLNLKELTTIIHFPVKGTVSQHLREAKSGNAPAPLNLLKEGTLLGLNSYRGINTNVYMGKEDRLRHFYVIGQTGTGKTVLLKNMILQDIEAGNGACMIDPHGTDIQDVLARIPDSRLDDVIYFDPSHVERPMGLNILEYDVNAPEQKTFVVDELLSIFNKLFDMKVAGGPMFEQYFRNATLLVMEDRESGNTLLDIGRIFTDQRFRELKLSRCKNPVVKTFWTEIASKTTGEQSLSNFAPYITNKFDVFTANEVMRPIVAQEKSAFNMRDVMDNKKILLINISKGKLGEINSNLIGLIVVGKILMAALSRVDSVGKEKLPDFYLYIDEFQNVTTPSIASILSEARKYGLSLNIAHQFIAQLEDNIKDAVFGNVGSMAIFRTGTDDAEFLQKQLEPVFETNDIVNLDNFNAYVKLLVNGVPVKPFNITTLAPKSGDMDKAQKLKELSYAKYGRDRSEIEEEIRKRYI